MKHRTTIDEISIALASADLTLLKSPASLMNGLLGKVLFFGYQYHYTKSEAHLKEVETSLDYLGTYLESNVLSTNLFTGYAGFGWTIQHLINLNIISTDQFIDFEELDDIIFSSVRSNTESTNYDLFCGLIGKGIYFLERPCTDRKAKIESICKEIISLKTVDSYGFAWRDTLSEIGNPNLKKELNGEVDYLYNLGLAHGIPSVLSFLSISFSKGIRNALLLDTIKMTSEWLLNFKKHGSVAFYGHFIDSAYRDVLKDKSSLAWCYGDLSIAISLIHAYKATKITNYLNHGFEIAKLAATRKLHNSFIFNDAKHNLANTGFCHGLTGVSHIFFRLFQSTGETIFKNAYQYWINQLYNFRDPQNLEMAGFTSYELDPEPTVFQNDITLLDGLAGIGLTLLTQEHNITEHWDSVFLTNL